ncbi:hypothetical protein RHMOL_Rhmol11G0046500 [Rhododendron molle]|uniref:Uncharacterized protein n=1 Tax=Rhododendron molle TaxID=49168 RepID=A0ACC0LNK6_RHOML|nr:hypothetical protein RHMOL_Rhmol11G0046500 [Rhododendron molle]
MTGALVPVEWANMARCQTVTMENMLQQTVVGHPLPMRRPNEPRSTQGPPPEANGLVSRERQSKRAEDTPAVS